jgi:hypothetical protein
MRMSENDARTRREHARRNGSASEYDALHGVGSYGRKPRARVRAFIENFLRRPKPDEPARGEPRTQHPW